MGKKEIKLGNYRPQDTRENIISVIIILLLTTCRQQLVEGSEQSGADITTKYTIKPMWHTIVAANWPVGKFYDACFNFTSSTLNLSVLNHTISSTYKSPTSYSRFYEDIKRNTRRVNMNKESWAAW